jgi:hypothetical protein
MATKYNWTKIKTERAAGHAIKSLALKHGRYKEKDAKFKGVYAYFRRKLKDVEEDTAVTKKIQDTIKKKTVEGLAEEEIELRVEYNKINKYIRYGVASELRKADETSFHRLKQLKISSEILANCKKMDWEIHEIMSKTLDEKSQLEIKKMRLEVDKITRGEDTDEGLKALADAIDYSTKRLADEQ